MRRKLVWGVLGLVAAAGVAALVVWRMATPPNEALSARADLLSAPQDVRLELSIDIPKGSEPDNPAHQEIDATGVVDLAAGTGELVYDFNELNNAAGFLGHFDTMDILFGDGAIHIDVFQDGPPWVRVVPDDIGNGEVGRLHDILLTNPLTIAAYLEAGAAEQEDSEGEMTRHLGPDALATVDDPFAAAIGGALRDWAVEVIEVELSRDDAGVHYIDVAFAYRPGGIGAIIEVRASYELKPAEMPPDVELPAENDTREYTDIFSPT